MKHVALLAGLLLLTAYAEATTTRPQEVVCPVCDREITVSVVRSTNTYGGPDLDLCGHARGTEPRTLAIWTCPHCLYSRHLSTFEDEVAEEIRERIRTKLTAEIQLTGAESQWDIPVHVKYGLAGRILEWEEAGAERLANHYIEAAWAVRCETSRALAPVRENARLTEQFGKIGAEIRQWALENPPPGSLDGFAMCRSDLEAADRLLALAEEEEREAEDAALHRLLAAAYLRDRGECHRALPIFAALAGDEGLDHPIRMAAEASVASINRERSFQTPVLSWLDRARRAGGIEPSNEAALCYIAGDTCRMLGRPDEAKSLYLQALEMEGGPAWIDPVVRDALERVGGVELNEERLAKARERRIARLIERLLDPETARDARDGLSFLKAREALPGIVGALGSEHATVRSQAALTLMDMPEPGPEAVAALCRVLLEDPESDPRLRAAVALCELGAPGARTALESSALEDDEERVRENALEALGFVGETSTRDVLLRALYADTESVEEALDILANGLVPTDLNTRAEYLEWWDEHRPGERRDWVKRGFAEAGIEIEDPWSRDSVPALLDLLSHEHHWIRANAVRVLREVSGRRLPYEPIASRFDWPQAVMERNAAIAEWRAWWEREERDKK